MGEGREHPADPLPRLVEIGGPERLGLEQLQRGCIHLGPASLHQVHDKVVAPSLVHVEEPEAEIEADRDARQASLGLQEAVEIVQDRIGRGGGEPR
jgi:hypothetical protein